MTCRRGSFPICHSYRLAVSINIQALLVELNRLDESPRIEAKKASEIGKAVMETVSAFSNTPGLGGGYLLLGVSKDEPDLFDRRYTVTGLDAPDKVMADLATQCASMLNVPVRPEMDREEVGGRIVVGAFIPEAEPDQKPVYIESKGLPKGAYLRVGSTDHRFTEADLTRVYQNRSVRHFDDTLLSDTSLSDRSPQAVENYRRERRRRDAGAPELEWDDEALLRGLKLVRDDAQGMARLTVAGLLLFGRADTLRDLFPAARVDYIRVQGRTWVSDAHERFTSLDRLGPVFEVIYQIEAAIMDDLPVAFSLPEDSLHRVDKPLIPRDVVREALVNALMHRDYQAHSPVQIIRYSNRIEFRNKGYSLKPEEQLGTPGSELRNPKLAGVLHQTRLAETKGSGIATMRRLMHEVDLNPPTFTSDRAQNRFVATFWLHHFLAPENLGWLALFDALGLSREDRQALVFVRESEAGRITNADYRNLNSVDTLAASQALRRLRDAGLLEQHDHGAATFYTPSTRLLDPNGGEDGPTTPAWPFTTQAKELTTQAPGVIPEAPAVIPQHPAVIPQPPAAIPQPPHVAAAPHAWAAVPDDLKQEIARAGRRATHGALRQILLRLCRLRPWTAEELAAVTGRTRDHLLRQHLSPLVGQGMLARTRTSATDPGQAYSTPQ